MAWTRQHGLLGGLDGLGLRGEGVGVVAQASQRVGDLLEGGEDGLPVLRCDRVARVDGRLALVVERTATEDGLRQAGADVPEGAAG